MLVNCVAYQDGRKLADVGEREVGPYLAEPGCFVWLAHKDPSELELADLQDEFELHPLAVEDARHGHQRPKIDEFRDQLFAVLHVVGTGNRILIAVPRKNALDREEFARLARELSAARHFRFDMGDLVERGFHPGDASGEGGRLLLDRDLKKP